MSEWKHRVETFHLDASDGIPNNPKLPVLLCRGVVNTDNGDLASELESRYEANGWTGTWRWGIYEYHHFHSTAHEVLGVARGSADT